MKEYHFECAGSQSIWANTSFVTATWTEEEVDQGLQSHHSGNICLITFYWFLCFILTSIRKRSLMKYRSISGFTESHTSTLLLLFSKWQRRLAACCFSPIGDFQLLTYVCRQGNLKDPHQTVKLPWGWFDIYVEHDKFIQLEDKKVKIENNIHVHVQLNIDPLPPLTLTFDSFQ